MNPIRKDIQIFRALAVTAVIGRLRCQNGTLRSKTHTHPIMKTKLLLEPTRHSAKPHAPLFPVRSEFGHATIVEVARDLNRALSLTP